jgi:quercetin dioxygenase-like cupin family protein
MDTKALDLGDLTWIAERDDSTPARPVASKTAIVGGNVETGRLDFFTRWEPDCYCSFHRHLADTVSVVMEGELWVEDLDGSRKVRPSGHYAATPAGRLHWEQAGPAGATVFYSVQSEDGRAFEVTDLDGNAIGLVTVADMLAGRFGR